MLTDEMAVDYLDWLALAETAARETGALLREKLNQPRRLQNKGYRDLVTDADFAAQEHITSLVRAHYPDHGFLVEETDTTLSLDGPVRWIIDPVDGTHNYSRHITDYSVSIGVAVADKVVAGVIYDPTRDEMFSAALSQGSRLNGRSITTSQIADVAEAFFAFDWSRSFEDRQRILALLENMVHEFKVLREIGSAALALAWVAAGRLDAYLNFKLGAWDFAAGQLLIQEAGGRITDVAGRPLSPLEDAAVCASTGAIHEQILRFLSMSM